MKTKALKIGNQNLAKIILVSCLFIFSYQTQAQNISVGININTAPRETVRYVEAPAPSYYYYPEIETYFEVNSSVYIYFSNNNWVRSRNLPVYYSDYDLRHGQRVIIDYNGSRPYNHYHEHKNKYKCKSYKKDKKYKKNKKRDH
jgi:hypothetical protein